MFLKQHLEQLHLPKAFLFSRLPTGLQTILPLVLLKTQGSAQHRETCDQQKVLTGEQH